MKWSYLPLCNLQSLSKPQAAALFCPPSHPQTLLGMAIRTPESTRVDKLLKLLLPGSPGFLVDYGHHRVPYQLLNSMQSFLETFCFICSRGIHGPSCKAGAQECPGGGGGGMQTEPSPASDQQCYLMIANPSCLPSPHFLGPIINWEPCRPVALFQVEACGL